MTKKIYLICLLVISLVAATSWTFVYKATFLVGNSMNPTLNDGVVIITKRNTDFTKSLEGLIITYDRSFPTTSICHRVIVDNGDTLITKGDNNHFPDPEILRSDITGIVVSVIPSWALFLVTFTFVGGFVFLPIFIYKEYTSSRQKRNDLEMKKQFKEAS